MPKHITDKVAKGVAMYKTNKEISVKEICSTCGISNNALTKARRSLGIEDRKNNSSEDKKINLEKVNKFITKISSKNDMLEVPEDFFKPSTISTNTSRVKKEKKNKEEEPSKKSTINDKYSDENIRKQLWGE